MRITDVTFTGMRFQLEKPLAFAFDDMADRYCGLVHVFTDEELVGIGEIGWWGPFSDYQRWKYAIEGTLKPMLVGEDPARINFLWQKMGGSGRAGAAAVDIALWDLAGKRLGVPIYSLLGGLVRNPIRMYASGLMIQPPSAAAEEALGYKAQGFTAMKMRIGRDYWRDKERVQKVRSAVGEGIELMVDPNCCYDVAGAVRIGRAISSCEIFHFEEPVPKWDYQGNRTVQELTGIPVAAGEHVPLSGFKELIDARGCSIVQPDPVSTGITETLQIIAYAAAHNLVTALHGFAGVVSLAANLHIAAATPNCNYPQELDRTPNPFLSELPVTPFELKNGYITVPPRPGLGVVLNPEMVHRHQISE
jgi:D-galactarolactone cycloisomerase